MEMKREIFMESKWNLIWSWALPCEFYLDMWQGKASINSDNILHAGERENKIWNIKNERSYSIEHCLVTCTSEGDKEGPVEIKAKYLIQHKDWYGWKGTDSRLQKKVRIAEQHNVLCNANLHMDKKKLIEDNVTYFGLPSIDMVSIEWYYLLNLLK